MTKAAPFHPLRSAGRARAADLAAKAQTARVRGGDSACTDRAIAKRFALSKHQQIGAWFDPESGVAVALGDVLALPRELARDILLRALASLEEGDGPAPEIALGDLAIKLGLIADGIQRDRQEDGVVNDHARHADRFVAAATVAVRGYLAAARRAGVAR
jgi:hypothetical protein